MATDGSFESRLLDLTDEAGLLARDRATYDPDGVRALLAELNLKPVSGPALDAPCGQVFDLAVYRATGDRRLASLFGTAA